MAAFDEYNGPRQPAAQHVTAHVVLNGNARAQALTREQVHVIEEPPYPSVAMLQNLTGLHAQTSPGWGTSTLSFNCSRPPFHDRRVRQAFLHAIDCNLLTHSTYSGQATPATSFLAEEHPFFKEPTVVYEYNPKRRVRCSRARGCGTVSRSSCSLRPKTSSSGKQRPSNTTSATSASACICGPARQ